MLVVGGESLIDLVADGMGPDGVPRFSAHAGGSPFNCARALALLGQQAGLLSPLSQDGFGAMLSEALVASGCVPLVVRRSMRPTTLAVVTQDHAGQPRYGFYREGTAERDLDAVELSNALPAAMSLFQIGGFVPIDAQDFAVWRRVLAAVEARGVVMAIDPNVRPALIADRDGYRARLNWLFERTHVVKLSDEDIAVLAPGMPSDLFARAVLEGGACRLVVVSRGAEGCVGYTRSLQVRVPAQRMGNVADTVGAGDCLMAGILAGLARVGALSDRGLTQLTQAQLERVLRFASVVAGINCERVGCQPPTLAEVLAAGG